MTSEVQANCNETPESPGNTAPVTVGVELSWCETTAAIMEHLRKLGPKGRCLSGGADTMTLCGLDPAWDLASPVTSSSLHRASSRLRYSRPCARCVAKATP